jgi:endoglucanase
MTDIRVNRRTFIAASAAGLVTTGVAMAKDQTAPEPPPRWRGFNLTDKLNARNKQPFREQDFEWIAGFGFNYVRLPMDYHCWTDPEDWLKLDEVELREVDAAVAWGRAHGVHANLCMHRIPGHGVASQGITERASLWDRGDALEAAAHHWRHFAQRHKGVPGSALSFNLLNEPPWDTPEEVYAEVVGHLTEVIRAEDPDRPIVADGLRVGTLPVPSITRLGIGQSLHWYEPFHLTHWQAPWVSWIKDFDQWDEPAWPMTDARGVHWDKEHMRAELAPWRELAGGGCPVQVGEFGVYARTPHPVSMAWHEDCLDLFREAGWGWVLWGFRGHFGILDTQRTDITYEPFHGHQLDRALLELLQRY